MRNKAEFKLGVYVDELLHCVVIVAEWQHLVN